MPALQMGLHRHLNAYHQTSPLLLQFSFCEFFQVYSQFLIIEKLITEEQFNHALFTALNRFSGPVTQVPKITNWSADNGSLSKLYHYATFLADKAQNQFTEFPHLEGTGRRCWILGSHLTEAIEDQDISLISSTLSKLQRSLKQLAKELAKAAILMRENENVIFFILRHRCQIDNIYGPKFTYKLLSSLFPSGLADIHRVLTDKYSKRGFDKVIETINHLLGELKK